MSFNRFYLLNNYYYFMHQWWMHCNILQHVKQQQRVHRSIFYLFLSTHSTKWLSYTLLYKMTFKTCKISWLVKSDWLLQFLNFFEDHDIGEHTRKKNEIGCRQFFAMVLFKTTRFGSLVILTWNFSLFLESRSWKRPSNHTEVNKEVIISNEPLCISTHITQYHDLSKIWAKTNKQKQKQNKTKQQKINKKQQKQTNK